MALKLALQVPLDKFGLEVDLEISAHTTGVFGPSGSGKTSLVETIIGLRKNAKGYVEWRGKTWYDSAKNFSLPVFKRHVGYVPQDGLLFPNKTVNANIRCGIKRSNKTPIRENLYRSAVDILDLGSLLDRGVESLSGGEKQRVALARALCSNPELMILDEPFASLDLELKHKILPYIKSVRDHFSVPLLIISHDPSDMIQLCEEVLIMRRGKIIANGPPLEVFNDPFVQTEKAGKFKNVFLGKWTGSEENMSLVELTDAKSPVVLRIPELSASQGDKVLLRIPARDIILSTEPVKNLSAQNILEGIITGIDKTDTHLLARCEVAGQPFIVEVTARAIERLSLKIGTQIYLVIKAHSVRIGNF